MAFQLPLQGIALGIALGIVEPEWSFFNSSAFTENRGAVCVNASANESTINVRWTQYAVPKGPTPANGWPVYLYFPPWKSYPGQSDMGNTSNDTCCGSDCQSRPVASCMSYLNSRCNYSAPLTTCVECVRLAAKDVRFDTSGCTLEQAKTAYCKNHAEAARATHAVFVDPNQVAASCFLHNGSYTGNYSSACQFSSMNGNVWAQRINQFLLSNGIAVVQVNPWIGKSWDWYTREVWETGNDRPFLRLLFAQWTDGTYGGLGKGVLNPQKLIVAGYSVGAQMASWLIQLHASGEMQEDLSGARVAAGAMFAGGSYACYREPNQTAATAAVADVTAAELPHSRSGRVRLDRMSRAQALAHLPRRQPKPKPKPKPTPPPPQPFPPAYNALHQCAHCNASHACWAVGCSNHIVALTGRQPCCQFCCPANFTEQYYYDHPEEYASHPPTFLAQHSTLDENADTCAARNYHETMVAHGAKSRLSLIPSDRERCYCIGQAEDSSSAGAEQRKFCPGLKPGLPPYVPNAKKGRPELHVAGTNVTGAYEDHSTERCMMHTMGFSEMVRPLVHFLLEVLYG